MPAKYKSALKTITSGQISKVFELKTSLTNFMIKIRMSNCQNLNKPLKMLRDSDSVTKRTGCGRCRSVQSDASLVIFSRYSNNI